MSVQRVLARQGDALLRIGNEGEPSNETMNRIPRELDLEESRLAMSLAPARGHDVMRPLALTIAMDRDERRLVGRRCSARLLQLHTGTATWSGHVRTGRRPPTNWSSDWGDAQPPGH